MNLFTTLSLFLSLVCLGQCRDLWSPDLPQGPEISLEKGKPIQLSKNYTKVQFCKLKGTLYSDSLSQLDGITELKLCQHQLEKIEKGSLCASSSVKVLDIDFYDNTYTVFLDRETFQNCNHLEELLLKFDNFNPSASVSLNGDVFGGLINLKKLALQGYTLPHLTANFLKVNTLKELVLSSDSLQQLDEDAFDNLTDLEVLYIVHNSELKQLPTKLFRKLHNLKQLVLRDNAIEGLTWDEFKGLSSLEELNVVDNRISTFDADRISNNLPSLERLLIDLNPGPCRLEEFVNSLKQKMKRSIEVSHQFNSELASSCD